MRAQGKCTVMMYSYDERDIVRPGWKSPESSADYRKYNFLNILAFYFYLPIIVSLSGVLNCSVVTQKWVTGLSS